MFRATDTKLGRAVALKVSLPIWLATPIAWRDSSARRAP